MNEITGRLEGWWYDEKNHVLWGHIYEDTRKRWYEGAYIHTSNISISRDAAKALEEHSVVPTRNSTYKLGKPSVNE